MRPFYHTRLGQAFLGDALDVLQELRSESVNLIVTSPPFPLTFRKKKPYGSVRIDEYIAWFLPIADQCKRVLTEDGSFVIDIGGVWNKGLPTRSLYQSYLLIEEAVVARLLRPDYLPRFRPIFDRMPEGQFQVISAEKASKLLREKLFDRVHALSLKGFTRKFRNAEVDMHYSPSQELTPVRTFLRLLIEESPQKFAVCLYTGEY